MVGCLKAVYLPPLQDIHPIAREFWSRLRFGLRIRNNRLPQDEQNKRLKIITNQNSAKGRFHLLPPPNRMYPWPMPARSSS